MKRSRYICAATTKGAVNLLDASSFEVIKTWNAHSAMINNMDAQHDYIVTCGYSLRYGQSYALDSFLNVFDMKKMKSIKPIAFPAKAAFVRLHPRMLTTAMVVSQQGQMHVVDLDNQDYPTTANMRQANVVSYLSMFDIAPSGEAIALADADSLIHLWGSPQRIRFLDFPIATEFANPPEPRQGEWGPNTPFNTIGMPYYRDELLSSWPANLVSDVGAPPVRLDARLLNTLTVADFGLYGRNTRALHRNQVENTRRVETASTSGIQAPKFLSEKARDSAKAAAAFETETNDLTALQNPGESSTSLVPNFYRSVEIKYSKFGVEDFDFGYVHILQKQAYQLTCPTNRFYNATRYSGLETHIVNSYANSLLQVLHFTPLVRNLALHHAASACIDESCMLCEMGFLSDMLQKAEGWACQATNMLKTLSRQPNGKPKHAQSSVDILGQKWDPKWEPTLTKCINSKRARFTRRKS
jgi:PAB-dependent poly(A)-specific ribonuclease subunit 2